MPGETVRIRLDNGYGADSVRIGRASIAYRVQGPLVAAGSSKPLTFGGTVIAKRIDGGRGLVDLDIAGRRGDDVLMPGTATVELPRRETVS